ncbi:MAG: hypothetical protein ACHQ49_12680 [Elusimicrobiota bacterium]
MRFSAKLGGLSTEMFNMSRTDMAGTAIIVCFAIFAVMFLKSMHD